MTSSANAEPKGSEPSSTELFAPGAEEYYRKVLGLPPKEPKPCTCGPDEACGDPCEPRSQECQHPNKYNYAASGNKKWTRYYSCPDCNAKWETVETFEEEPERCESCGHIHLPNTHTCGYATDEDECCECKGLRPAVPEEPPMTPEEEEQAPPDRIHPADCVHEDGCQYLDPTCENGCKVAADELTRLTQELPPPKGPEYEKCVCGHIVPEHEPHGGLCFVDECGCAAYRTKPDFELPPQPDRRPPYAVSYSVQGHLYEVALPGDATVRAVDGALVIQHPLGPVAGIVQVLPVVNGEGA